MSWVWLLVAAVLLVIYLERPPRKRDPQMYFVPISRNFISVIIRDSLFAFYERWLKAPLEQHGVICTWVGGTWAVMVTDPVLISEIFRRENVYAKAGFRGRVPWGYFAYLFSDNIIDSHGAPWSKMMQVMKTGIIDRPLDVSDVHDKTRRLTSLFQAEQQRSGSVLPDSYLRRYTMSINGQHFFDCDFGTLDCANTPMESIMAEAVRVRPHAIVTQFPFLERFPWCLVTRRNKPGFQVADEFHRTLLHAVTNRKVQPQSGSLINSLEKARDKGVFSDNEYIGNLLTMFVASHENLQLALNSVLWALGNNPAVQERVRQETLAAQSCKADTGAELALQDIEKMPYLLATIYETLRHYPPLFQMTNRVAIEDTVLAGRFKIQKGTWISWNAREAHYNPEYWPDAASFDPERWGSTISTVEEKARKMQLAGAFISFSSHARKCIGKHIAMAELKIAIAYFVSTFRWTIHPDYKYKMPPTGSIMPQEMRIIIEPL